MACAVRDLKLNICASQDNYLSSSQMRRITDVVSTDYLSVVKFCKTINRYSLVVNQQLRLPVKILGADLSPKRRSK